MFSESRRVQGCLTTRMAEDQHPKDRKKFTTPDWHPPIEAFGYLHNSTQGPAHCLHWGLLFHTVIDGYSCRIKNKRIRLGKQGGCCDVFKVNNRMAEGQNPEEDRKNMQRQPEVVVFATIITYRLSTRLAFSVGLTWLAISMGPLALRW